MEYIKKELGRYPSPDGLRSLLLERVTRHADGFVFSFLPFVPPAVLLAEFGEDLFSHSLLWHSDLAESYDEHWKDEDLTFIREWLTAQEARLALFQTCYGRSFNEPGWGRRVESERVVYLEPSAQPPPGLGREGWVFIDRHQATIEEIDLAIARGMRPFPPTVGILTPDVLHLSDGPPSRQISIEDCRMLANAAEYLVVEAFDLEALLFARLGSTES